MSWICDTKTEGEAHLEAPYRSGDALKAYVTAQIQEFIDDDARDLDWIISDSYPYFEEYFADSGTINAMSADEIFELLCKTNAFRSALWHRGGRDPAREKFLQMNDMGKVKKITKLFFR